MCIVRPSKAMTLTKPWGPSGELTSPAASAMQNASIMPSVMANCIWSCYDSPGCEFILWRDKGGGGALLMPNNLVQCRRPGRKRYPPSPLSDLHLGECAQMCNSIWANSIPNKQGSTSWAVGATLNIFIS